MMRWARRREDEHFRVLAASVVLLPEERMGEHGREDTVRKQGEERQSES